MSPSITGVSALGPPRKKRVSPKDMRYAALSGSSVDAPLLQAHVERGSAAQRPAMQGLREAGSLAGWGRSQPPRAALQASTSGVDSPAPHSGALRCPALLCGSSPRPPSPAMRAARCASPRALRPARPAVAKSIKRRAFRRPGLRGLRGLRAAPG